MRVWDSHKTKLDFARTQVGVATTGFASKFAWHLTRLGFWRQNPTCSCSLGNCAIPSFGVWIFSNYVTTALKILGFAPCVKNLEFHRLRHVSLNNGPAALASLGVGIWDLGFGVVDLCSSCDQDINTQSLGFAAWGFEIGIWDFGFVRLIARR